MRSNSLVTTIIPTYNRAHIVGRAIECALGQTYKNTEIIVVDDGSTDGTPEQLQSYGERIRVIVQENAGPAAARNRGIEQARGDMVAFLDSDDVWKPTKLERQVALLEKAGDHVPCCLCNAVMKFSRRKQRTSFQNAPLDPPCEEGIWTNVSEVLATRFVLFNQSVLIRRAVLEKVGGFDESLKFLEDYDLPLRLSLEGPWAFIREPLVIWTQGSSGSWSQKALDEDVNTKECLVRIRERMSKRVRTGSYSEALVDLMDQALNKARRDLFAARVRCSGFWGARMLGNLLDTLERYRTGVYRRLPSYPRMKTLLPGELEVR